MSCIAPPQLEVAELLKYIDGESGPETVQHIADCEHCRSRAAEYGALQIQLITSLFRAECPPAEKLGAYSANTLSRKEAKTVRDHLQNCPYCAPELDEIRDWEKTLAAEERPSGDNFVRYIATLLQGNQAPLAIAPGLRGDKVALTYDTDVARIVLEAEALSEETGQRRLTGTIFGQNLPALAARMWQGNALVDSVDIDRERGTFEIVPLATGVYELSIIGKDIEIQIPEVLV